MRRIRSGNKQKNTRIGNTKIDVYKRQLLYRDVSAWLILFIGDGIHMPFFLHLLAHIGRSIHPCLLYTS